MFSIQTTLPVGPQLELHTRILNRKSQGRDRRTFYTSSTAQGGGRSFKIGYQKERFILVNQEWQSEPTDE